MKSKTWEDWKNKIEKDLNDIGFSCSYCESGNGIQEMRELVEYVASQIEKTQREAFMDKSTRDSYIHVGFKRGFKAGLARAIELMPKRKNLKEYHKDTSNPVSMIANGRAWGWNLALTTVRENLKKEMEK